MTSRSQCVAIGSDTSDDRPLRWWVSETRGSVLGALLFSIYTMPLQRVIKNHGNCYHKFAGNLQIYISYCPDVPGGVECALHRLALCVDDIRSTKNKLGNLVFSW